MSTCRVRSAVRRGLILAIVASAALATLRASQAPGPARRIALEGVPNLRDLGGYETTDGRKIRWGRVYRSGQLAALTERDYQTLAALGIVAVCDFRTAAEQKAAPTVWTGANPPQLLSLPAAAMPDGETAADPVGTMRRGGTADEVAASMRASYALYPTRFAESHRRIIELILSDAGPVLFHCTAGKDRTGFFAAALMTALGVPRATIEQDYLLSNDYAGTTAAVSRMAAQTMVSADAAAALLTVNLTYLNSAFQAIDRTFGSFEAYRRTALGLSDDRLQQLRKRLLE